MVSAEVRRRAGALAGVEEAEAWLKRREGAAVFLSRRLLTPLGPVVNLTAGATEYPWPRFLLYDVLGVLLLRRLREPGPITGGR